MVSNIDSSQSLGGLLVYSYYLTWFVDSPSSHIAVPVYGGTASTPPIKHGTCSCSLPASPKTPNDIRRILFQKFVQETKSHKSHCVYRTTARVLPRCKSQYLKFKEVGQFQSREQGGCQHSVDVEQLG